MLFFSEKKPQPIVLYLPYGYCSFTPHSCRYKLVFHMFIFLSKFYYKNTVEDLTVLGKTSQRYHFHLSVDGLSRRSCFYFFNILQRNISHVEQASHVLCFRSKSPTMSTVIRVPDCNTLTTIELHSLSINTPAGYKNRGMLFCIFFK